MIAPARNDNIKSSKRRRGRPVGSQTAERPIVDLTPSPCPHCNAIVKPINLDKPNRITGSGRLPDGRQYGAVILRTGNCGACGKPLTVRSHEFTP